MTAKKRKVIIASPREPCGATWLINCFLELRILTYRTGDWRNMWNKEGAHFLLKPEEDILKKWLPSLSARVSFPFSEDLQVEWVHEWPSNRFETDQIVYFLRDPRDALYSRYKREAPNMSYHDYVNFLDPQSLLDKAETNAVFTRLWMQHPRCRVFTFEQYKADPASTLRKILEFIGVAASEPEIASALSASTAEKAAQAEKYWNDRVRERETVAGSEIGQVVNQGGIVGRWEELQGDDRRVAERIGTLSNAIVGSLPADGQITLASYLGYLRKHRMWAKGLNFDWAGKCDMRHVDALERKSLTFARLLTWRQATNARLYQHEVVGLLEGLADLSLLRDKIAMKNIEHEYQRVGTRTQLYLGVFRRTRVLLALGRCDPLFLLTLFIRKILARIRREFA